MSKIICIPCFNKGEYEFVIHRHSRGKCSECGGKQQVKQSLLVSITGFNKGEDIEGLKKWGEGLKNRQKNLRDKLGHLRQELAYEKEKSRGKINYSRLAYRIMVQGWNPNDLPTEIVPTKWVLQVYEALNRELRFHEKLLNAIQKDYGPVPKKPKKTPTKSVESVKIKHASGGSSYLTFRSYDQKRKTFEGTEKTKGKSATQIMAEQEIAFVEKKMKAKGWAFPTQEFFAKTRSNKNGKKAENTIRPENSQS